MVGTALVALFAGAAGPAIAQTALPQVVVTGTRFNDDAQTLPFGVSVITAREIERSGVTTVNEAVMKLLGVPGRLDFYGGGDYALDLRGFGGTSGSNQIVIVDGVRLNEADLSGSRLAGIAIDTVDRIEVLRGSGTVLYGEGATGGVIVVTTKAGRGVARSNRAQLYGGVGSFNTREARASATLAEGDFSLDVAGNQRTADNHRDNFKSDARGGSIGAQWSRDDLRLAVRHAADKLETGLPGALTAAQYASNPRQTTSPDNRASISNARTTLLGEARLGDWELGLDFGVRDKALRSVSVSSFGASRYDYDVASQNYALRARHRGTLAGLGNSLIVGVDGGEWRRTVQGSFGSVSTQDNQAVYLRDELTLAGGTRLSAGARSESIQKGNDSGLGLDRRQRAWEFGVVQPVSEQLSVFARVGNSFRLANADEYNYAAQGGDLSPQTSRDTEIGARWRLEATRLELRAYRNKLKNEIGYDPLAFGPFDTTTPFGANVNFDPTRRQGVEFDASHSLTRAVQLRANLAWRDARFLSGTYAGKQVPLTSHRTASVGADWQVAAQHQLAANLFYASQRHPDFNNSCSMPSITTLDLRYAYQLTAGELSVGVGNATDRKHYTQAFGCTAGVTQSIYPEAGRTVNAAARWRF